MVKVNIKFDKIVYILGFDLNVLVFGLSGSSGLVVVLSGFGLIGISGLFLFGGFGGSFDLNVVSGFG